ncbi:MAG: radical SAM protein, partial [archaeon]
MQELKEAKFYSKLKDKNIRCNLCYRSCIIAPGKSGFCNVRKNLNGKLYSLVYGKPCSINIDPIEKKPIYNYLPGTKTLSLATV